MGVGPPTHLVPRRTPLQARSSVTVDAILEATLQVLLAEGQAKITTTRVAKRAGVSVGTLYQYFPHKQALVYALNESYLNTLAARIETVCRSGRGAPVEQMIRTLIDTYWNAKTERPEVTRALYSSVVEIDNQSMVNAFAAKVDAAATAMLATAADAAFEDPASVSLALLTVIFGTVRNAFERDLPEPAAAALRGQVLLMCQSYLETIKIRQDNPAMADDDVRRLGQASTQNVPAHERIDRKTNVRTPAASQ